MREINNTNLGKIQPDIKVEKQQNIEVAKEEIKEDAIQDFSNPKAESLGRSQVMSSDSLKKDVEFLIANPKAVKDAEAFFNMAYADLLKKDVPNAYEKAAAMATLFAQEVATK